jgi:hypothetical protein
MPAPADVFYLNTFPCRRVEIVGLIVGIDVRENRTTFLGARARAPSAAVFISGC